MGRCQYQKSGICPARPPHASRARRPGRAQNDENVRCLRSTSLRLSRAASCGCDKPSPGRRACHTGAWRYPRTPCRTPGTSSYTRVARTRAVWPLLNARLPFREVRRPARRRSYRLMVCSVRAEPVEGFVPPPQDDPSRASGRATLDNFRNSTILRAPESVSIALSHTH
jgi:hypothetical protein